MQAHPFVMQLEAIDLVRNFGFVKKVGNTHVEADGPLCAIGDICSITLSGDKVGAVDAEVVGIEENHITLVPFQPSARIGPESRVESKSNNWGRFPVGDAFSGRAIDALGKPIDDQGPIVADNYSVIESAWSATLNRRATSTPMTTGIKAIDTLLTLTQGQRIGVFAPAGVGKTTLTEQIARQTHADRTIICLVGERGQEVHAMWEACQSMPDRERFTLLASTSDESAALRVRAPNYAIGLAEFWRDKGEHVLLILDSATRLAMALREVGLAAGEPPTVRAYTPSVFSAMPRLVEKCGAVKSGGAISAVMTVLAEDEDVDDPLSEVMKSILDGHIILSRSMAEQGHFPAIDIGRSISRQAIKALSDDDAKLAAKARKFLALYEESRTFVESGVYRKGTNADLDHAIEIRARLVEFLTQGSSEKISKNDAFEALGHLLGGGK